MGQVTEKDDDEGRVQQASELQARRVPPCTGYEADYERIEKSERDASWR